MAVVYRSVSRDFDLFESGITDDAKREKEKALKASAKRYLAGLSF